ncbi:MAG: chromosomal replication initiator protein DnaA [Candidatus Marinimicrobia bacterium]|nr:chromosomal replication initiator protein DnaA [Candidatus Neomarinimicrobiota bacterium]
MENTWNNIKDLLKENLPSHAYNTWLEPIGFIGYTDGEIVLEVPNQFFYEWIDSHYKKQIIHTASSIVGKNISIKYTIAPDKDIKLEKVYPEANILLKIRKNIKPNLNIKYTFASFIEGTNNQFARAAASSVAVSPGKQTFNPLLIYGGVGLGKTHLLHAIGNLIMNENEGARVIIASSEKFTMDFISSIQKNKTTDFSKMYRKTDVLLIDDIQFFQNKEQTQEQFFHTFNDLYQRGKQIVMTADKLPNEMKGLTDRLVSRFESGLVVDIQPPDFETRVAILLEKAEQSGLDLPYDIVEFMATHIKNNVRELEGTIIRLLAYSSLASCEIDFDLVKKVVRERIGEGIASDISAGDIIRRVSEATKISEKDIVGSSRRMQIAEARQVAIYLCREIMGTSLMETGMHFGGRDHTTVLHACRNIEKKIKTDKRVSHLVRYLQQDLTFSLI